jgi:nucleotide-binding universal stress UspA family protein
MAPILVCTDGSLYSSSVYAHARWAATRCQAPVHLLHLIERSEYLGASNLSGNIGFDASAELLEELTGLKESHARIARLRGKAILEDARCRLNLPNLTASQRYGSLVETLMEIEDSEERPALIVIGKRGAHVDFARGHLGSNLERVIRCASVPVLVAARDFQPIKRFLLAFDAGPSAAKALAHTLGDPLLAGLECHLLAVGKPGSQLAADHQRAAAELAAAGFSLMAELLPGDPEEVLASEIVRRKISLLVMGAYGHSRIRHLILGSTTTALIRSSHLPVLLFR